MAWGKLLNLPNPLFPRPKTGTVLTPFGVAGIRPNDVNYLPCSWWPRFLIEFSSNIHEVLPISQAYIYPLCSMVNIESSVLVVFIQTIATFSIFQCPHSFLPCPPTSLCSDPKAHTSCVSDPSLACEPGVCDKAFTTSAGYHYRYSCTYQSYLLQPHLSGYSSSIFYHGAFSIEPSTQ